MGKNTLIPELPIVVIGSGLAGFTTIRELRKLNQTVPITLVTREPGYFYSKPMLSNALANNKQAKQLISSSKEDMATQLGIHVKVKQSYETVIERTRAALKAEGFGVLTEIDVMATLKKKLDVNFRPYRILGACNPQFAYQALQSEDKVGTMLPCNVVVQQHEDGTIEVSAIDPVASMMAVQNNSLGGVATEVQAKLKRVIDSL